MNLYRFVFLFPNKHCSSDRGCEYMSYAEEGPERFEHLHFWDAELVPCQHPVHKRLLDDRCQLPGRHCEPRARQSFLDRSLYQDDGHSSVLTRIELSSQPWDDSVGYSETIRIRNIYNDDVTARKRAAELTEHLVNRGHSRRKVRREVKRSFNIPRQEIVVGETEARCINMIPLVTTNHSG